MAAGTHYGELFRQRNFMALFLGQIISRVGDGVFKIAVTWTVWEATSSSALVAVALILQTVPPLLFSFSAGIAADRHVHRNLMMISDLLRLLVTVAAAVLGWTGHLNHWVLSLAGFAVVSSSTFFSPARSAMISRLISREHLVAANGLLSGSFQAAVLIGTLLGGWLLRFTTAPTLLMIDALTFAVSLSTLATLPVTTSNTESLPASLYADVRDGMATVRGNPALFSVIATFGIGTFLAGGIFEVGQTILMDHIGSGSVGLGLMGTAVGVGLMAGSFLCGRRAMRHQPRVVMLAWAASGLLLVLFGFSRSLPAALVVVFMSGLTQAYVDVPTESLIQLCSGAHTGKVFSYWTISLWLGSTLSLALLAPLFSRFSLTVLCAAAGLVMALLALTGAWRYWSLTAQVPEAESVVQNRPGL